MTSMYKRASAGALLNTRPNLLVGVRSTVEAVITISPGGVTIRNNGADVTASFPYMARILSGLHANFSYARTPGLTPRQLDEYKSGVVLVGHLEPRKHERGWIDTDYRHGADDAAFTVVTAIPLSRYKRGTDNVDVLIRRAHLSDALVDASLTNMVEGVNPAVREAPTLGGNPWHRNAQALIAWDRALFAVLKESFASVLVFDPFAAWNAKDQGALLIDGAVCEEYLTLTDDEL